MTGQIAEGVPSDGNRWRLLDRYASIPIVLILLVASISYVMISQGLFGQTTRTVTQTPALTTNTTSVISICVPAEVPSTGANTSTSQSCAVTEVVCLINNQCEATLLSSCSIMGCAGFGVRDAPAGTVLMFTNFADIRVTLPNGTQIRCDIMHRVGPCKGGIP